MLHSTGRKQDALRLGAVLLLGFGVSWVGYQGTQDNEQLRSAKLRDVSAQAVIDILQKDISRTVGAVRSAARMAETHPQLQRRAFDHYSAQTFEQLHTIHSLEWTPVVTKTERQFFELAARRSGLDGFALRELSDDAWVSAQTRDEHMPVLFVWPPNNAPVGFDIASRPMRLQTLLLAKQLNQPVASPGTQFFNASLQASGFRSVAISAPVHQLSGALAQEGKRRVSGYVTAVVELPELMAQAQLHADREQFDLLVYDLQEGSGKPLFAGLGPLSDLQASTLEHYKPSKFDRALTLDMAHRPWEVVLHPRPALLKASTFTTSNLILLAGLSGTLLLCISIARAQSSRRASEAAIAAELAALDSLALEQKRLHDILEATGAGTWEFNLQTGEIRVNLRWWEMLGYTPQDFPNANITTWSCLGHPDEREPMRAYQQRLLLGDTESVDLESRRRHKDGHWVWILTRGQVVDRDAQGRPQWVIGINQDIHARKKTEEQLVELYDSMEQRVRERTAELQEAMQTLRHSQEELTRSETRATLGTLVASVSHEMGTPMGNSLVTANALEEQTAEFAAQVLAGSLKRSALLQYLHQVQEGTALLQRNVQRASELLQSFRQVAADQVSEQKRSFNLRQALEEVLETLPPSHKTKPYRVHLSIPENIVMDSYPGPLGQVAINLINNAYLHAFEKRDHGTVCITAELQGPTVHLQFKDDGVGIAPAILQRLFEPFFSTKIGSGGTGLGMSIVENLVTKTLQGQLKVESVLGQGTTITIDLPLKVA